jgi:glycosyltransferase involved in cell wall biosynthesis
MCRGIACRAPAAGPAVSLTVLNVAYPFAPVGPGAVGGAEQIVSHIDRGLVRAGHRSIVVAAADSEVAGTLVAVSETAGPLDTRAREIGWHRHRAAIAAALQRWPVDLVHLHGIDFDRYLPPPGIRALVTLHLPPAWYAADALRPTRRDVWFHCVSQTQHETCPPHPTLLPPIPNGVPVDALAARHARRGFALMLGRICPEKGVHLALDAARRAGIALLIAGAVFPYPEHERYFVHEVQPRLDNMRRFIGPVDFRRKRRLLSAARCVIIASLAEETSSLVAMEALACGTPVVAFPHGAVPEIVENGRTGFLVHDVAEMAEAMSAVERIDPQLCRTIARRRFSCEAMLARYIERYWSIVSLPADAAAAETLS